MLLSYTTKIDRVEILCMQQMVQTGNHSSRCQHDMYMIDQIVSSAWKQSPPPPPPPPPPPNHYNICIADVLIKWFYWYEFLHCWDTNQIILLILNLLTTRPTLLSSKSFQMMSHRFTGPCCYVWSPACKRSSGTWISTDCCTFLQLIIWKISGHMGQTRSPSALLSLPFHMT